MEAGADVNVHDKDGDTALMHAAYGHQRKCVKLLLAQGATVGRYQIPDRAISDIESKKQFTRLMIVLFSSGQELLGLDEEYTKEALLKNELSLKNICRESIRNHLLQMSNVNLFVRVPRLGLPLILTDYLLYDQTLDDDADDDVSYDDDDDGDAEGDKSDVDSDCDDDDDVDDDHDGEEDSTAAGNNVSAPSP